MFNADKSKCGFKKDNTELEIVLLGRKEKIISKLYKILLGWFTKEETVKTQMFRWAEDFKKNIAFETWEFFGRIL